jgi:hypothetical protein
MSERSLSAALDNLYLDTLQPLLVSSRNLTHGAPADAASFTFDKKESQSVALALIVANQITNVIAGVRKFSSLNSRINPPPHFIGH